MKKSALIYVQFVLSAVVGATVACSPTKFSDNVENLCTSATDSCVVADGITKVTQTFKVGSGKVDILFVDDNSASMSIIQSRLAARFSGFIEALDQKEIDYQIGITTTDANFSTTSGLVTFNNGQKILKKTDSNRVSLFNGAIVRTETSTCEAFIKSAYYTYGPGFQETGYYAQNYNQKCPSNDERGILSAYEVVSKNVASLIRPDAHLNIIALSNEDVRSGLYAIPQYATAYALENRDTATGLINMINTNYAGKYWEFNSIIAKDNACATQQGLDFVDNYGNTIRNSQGSPVINSNIGAQYAAVSASASRDVDGNVAPRGQMLSICSNDYASYFSNIAANISNSARLLTLKCTPMEAPVVTALNGVQSTIPYSWDGNSSIIFQRGSEGIQIQVSYRCRTGVR